MSRPERILIIGNSGAGKTVLAEKLGASSGARVHSLDDLHWLPGGFDAKRDRQEALRLAREAAAQEHWIIEGVFGWLAEAVAERAERLIWLDLDWSSCAEGLRSRGGVRGEHWVWAQAYWSRETSSSYAGHLAIYRHFAGPKLRLSDRRAVADFCASRGGAE